MRFYSTGQLSNSEKSNILDKHKELYDGYRKVWQPVSNEQPLYTQDFANDKEGLVVNNRGDVKTYTNVGINEQTTIEEIGMEDLVKGKKYKYKSPSFEDEVEYESETDYPQGEKMFGFKGEKASHSMAKKHIEDFLTDLDEGLYDVQDIDPKASFDYIEKESKMDDLDDFTSAFSDEIEEETGGPLYSEVKPAYDFVSDGPMREEDDEDEYAGFFFGSDDESEFDGDDHGKEDDSFYFKGKKRSKKDIEDIDWEDIDDDIKESLMKQKNKIDEMFHRFSKYN